MPFLLLVHVASAVVLSEWEATQGRCATDPHGFRDIKIAEDGSFSLLAYDPKGTRDGEVVGNLKTGEANAWTSRRRGLVNPRSPYQDSRHMAHRPCTGEQAQGSTAQ